VKRKKLRLAPVLIGISTGFLVLFFSLSQFAENLENRAFDQFSRWTADPSKWPDDIVILLVDEASLQEMGKQERWPWNRKNYAGLVAYLKKAGAKAVVFDVLFSEESFAQETEGDDLFGTFIKASSQVSLASKQTDKRTLNPIPALRDSASSIGFVNVDKDADGIVRKYPLKDTWQDSKQKPLGLAFNQDLSTPSSDSLLLRWHATTSQLSGKKVFSIIRFIKLGHQIFDDVMKEAKAAKLDPFDPSVIARLLEKIPEPQDSNLIKNKIVFIGCSGAATFDPIAIPLSGYETGVMTHATALANIIRGDFLKPLSLMWSFAFILCSSALVTVICSGIRKIRWQVLYTLIIVSLIFGFSFFLFTQNYWIAPICALLAGLLSFTSVTTYNYFVEGKQNRQIRQMFSDFVSPDVLTELEETGLDLRGDMRLGTVLFCDLVGFTTFIETAPSHQSIKAINRYLSDASEVLLARKAYVDKFIGDAVMAIFNIPLAQPDHAIQACRAALDLQQMMINLNQDLGKEFGLKLGLRTGVNTGSMVAGPMGYARKLNYSAIGDTVNLSSRLEGANKAYHTEIMIGPMTYDLAKDHFEFRFLDLLRVKGKKIPVRVYELMAAKDNLSQELIRLNAAYHEGIELYRQRQWNDAKKSFERALSINKEDGPSQTYIERCVFYLKEPPNEDWDGSFGLDSK
jgi:adenylate cyclase